MSDMFPDARDHITAIVAMPEGERGYAINTFLRTQQQLARELAFQALRHHRISARDSELVYDVTQVFLMTALELVRAEIDEPGSITGVARWEAVLTRRGRKKAQEFLDSANPLASPTHQRRMRYLSARRSEYTAQFGVEPDADQLLEFANSTALERRKDAARQGMQFTEADMRAFFNNAPSSKPVLAAIDRLTGDYVPSPEDLCSSFVLSPAESPEFVKTVVDRSARVSTRCGLVAQTWFGEFICTGGSERRVLEPHEVGERLGLSVSQVHTQQIRIREIAVEILTEAGIGPADL